MPMTAKRKPARRKAAKKRTTVRKAAARKPARKTAKKAGRSPTVHVKVTGVDRNGRTVITRRTYHPCAKHAKRGRRNAPG